MATDRNIRVSDADRDAVAAQLREHYAQGRLTLDELNERLDRAFASRTDLELAAVTSDLPYAPVRGVLPADRVRASGSGHWDRAGQYRGSQHRAGQGWADPGGGDRAWNRSSKAPLLGILPLICFFACFLILTGVMGFGLGSGPSLVVLIIGALAVLRRLLGLGRRRPMPVRHPRRRW